MEIVARAFWSILFLVFSANLLWSNGITHSVNIDQLSDQYIYRIESIDTLEIPIDSVYLFRDRKENQRVVIMIPEDHQPERAWTSSVIFGVASVVSIGILYAMPPETTNWNNTEISFQNLRRQYVEHVSNGPVVDGDNPFINYVMHPYFGSVYYMSMRGAGYEWYWSALYSAGMSTLFWEYGFEALFETPSTQDLLSTPIVGSLMGEGCYQLKKSIKRNEDKVLGSRAVGHFTMFFLDPLNEVQDLFITRRIKRELKRKKEMNSQFVIVNNAVGLKINVDF